MRAVQIRYLIVQSMGSFTLLPPVGQVLHSGVGAYAAFSEGTEDLEDHVSDGRGVLLPDEDTPTND